MKKSKSHAEPNDSRLISIRMPERLLGQLREVAEQKGNCGYQKLIKNYIQKGLGQEEAAETPPSKAKKKIARHDIESLTHSRIISEDIEQLAESLRDYHRFFAGRTFLITGAFGFLGRYIVHLLKYLNDSILEEPAQALLLDNFVTGYEQRVLSDHNLEFVRHNVIEKFETEREIDYVLHMAGIASPVYYTKYPIETMDVGTIGTRHMLELAMKKNVKSFLFTSSSEVYGDPDPKHVPTKEDYYGNVSILGPRACYDESKRFGETMCMAFWKTYNVPVKMVRPFNVYGPGIRPDDFRVLPNFIEHALRREPLPIHGDGRNTRSFCYISDGVESLLRVLFSSQNGEAYNIGNPEPEISVKDLAHMIKKLMPYEVKVVNIDAPHAVYASSDPKRRCPDISKLMKNTGFKPRYDLDTGLKRTIDWFSEF
ncbi:MAG: NAD-dependent epimerase/dehydratase family protein [Candidatus Omnitrophota bacterium]